MTDVDSVRLAASARHAVVRGRGASLRCANRLRAASWCSSAASATTTSDRAVDRLDYKAHPSAEAQLREVAERVAAKHPVTAVAVTHRVGELAIGDIAVVVAASCPHRGEAFAAARDLIDELKATVPIWKHQLFGDGGEEWVGTP